MTQNVLRITKSELISRGEQSNTGMIIMSFFIQYINATHYADSDAARGRATGMCLIYLPCTE